MGYPAVRCRWPGNPCCEPGNHGGYCKFHRRRLVSLGATLPPAMVDATPVLDRIRQHLARGGDLNTFATRTGVAGTSVRAVYFGESTVVRATTAHRVLGVPLRPSNVGCVRRIRALRRMGYGVEDIARRMDVPLGTVSDSLFRGRFRCEVADRLDRVFRQLVAHPEVWCVNKRVVAGAIRDRCVPHLAWDDIDDPDGHPDWSAVRRVTPKRSSVDRVGVCAWHGCGKEFWRRRRSQRFCSPDHARIAKNERRAAERRAERRARSGLAGGDVGGGFGAAREVA